MPSKHVADPILDPLKVVSARVDRIAGAVLLTLPSGQQGRLEWADSLAATENRAFESYDRYQPGKTLAVVVYRRSERDHGVCFVNERWAVHNPWSDIEEVLKEGDLISGVVTEGRIPGRHGTGYLIQLDTAAPVRTADGTPLQWEDGTPVWQPGITVLLRAEELPSAGGSTDEHSGSTELPLRMELREGDRVAALVREVRSPPLDPLVSVLRLLHHQDVAFYSRVHGEGRQSKVGPKVDERGERRRLVQQAIGEWQQLHATWAAALSARHIVIVDDQPTAHSLLAPVLRSFGARVTVIAPELESDHWSLGRYQRELENCLPDGFDLLLVDDGLPATHDGERLIGRLAAGAARSGAGKGLSSDSASSVQSLVRSASGLSKIYLMSANTMAAERNKEQLAAIGVSGTLRRPLQVQLIADLLGPDCEPVWAWSDNSKKEDHAGDDVLLPNKSTRLVQLLHQGLVDLSAEFVLLLEVGPDHSLKWISASGRPPFSSDRLSDVALHTQIRELTLGLAPSVVFSASDPPSIANPRSGLHAVWRALTDGEIEARSPAFLLAVGAGAGRFTEVAAKWFARAVETEISLLRWRHAFVHQSSALAAGWLAQGYAHEHGSRQENAEALLTELTSLIGRGKAAGGVVDVESIAEPLNKLRTHMLAAVEMSQRLLKGQRNRERAIHLPSWLERTRAVLFAQCKEQDVALHVTTVPDLTIGVPEMVLTVALSNLVLNAAKHHYREDSRWILVAIAVSDDASRLHIDVQDNGPGLSIFARQHLFEPGHSWAADADKRHGIGLWLSRLLLRDARGELTVEESWRGVGTRFRIAVPISPP